MCKFFGFCDCCLPHKGTNFLANHNVSQAKQDYEEIVVYPTKVLIF